MIRKYLLVFIYLNIAFIMVICLCALWLPEHTLLTTLSSVKIEKSLKKRFIQYDCLKLYCGGWADRLKGITSAWAWSLLTQRSIKINMQFPCDLSRFMLPNNLDWTVTNHKYNETYLDFVGHRKKLNEMKSIDLESFYSDIDLIRITNNYDWVTPLGESENVQAMILKLGFTQNEFNLPMLFKRIYRKLFKLNKRLDKKYRRFLVKAKPTRTTKLICAQIRIGGPKRGIEYDAKFMPRNSSVLFWKFIKENFIEKMNLSDYKIFVTSDTESVQDEAYGFFGKEKIVSIPGEFLHMELSEIRENECKKLDKVFLDFHAMQNCDMAVISKSGFGMLGIWNRDEPFKDLFIYRKMPAGDMRFIPFNLESYKKILNEVANG